MNRKFLFPLLTILLLARATLPAASPSFADFDLRAKAGEQLSVVFFGASLTWGANATDPNLTSYRAEIGRRLEATYPKAHFHFWDSAIGGTGSQLGVFRFDRDVLSHQPDLVFLDFSANDDIYSDNTETLASYESLVRRAIVDTHAPVVQVIFPFKWNVVSADLEKMKRRDGHLAIAGAYQTVVGDAIALAIDRVKSGATPIEALWPYDGVHPGNGGYVLFADAAWHAFEDGVQRGVVCAAPAKMLNADTYLRQTRFHLASLRDLPTGWRRGAPNLTSAYFDMLMSRWLDDEVIASNRVAKTGADGKKELVPQETAPLKLKFRGSTLLLFGEGTTKSGKYRAYIDGKLVKEFDAASIAARSNGNTHHWQVISENLDVSVDHTLEIELVFAADTEQELRIESICVAGGDARVLPIQAP